MLVLILGLSSLAIRPAIQVTHVRWDWPMVLLGAGFTSAV
jgi:hypothetical protein